MRPAKSASPWLRALVLIVLTAVAYVPALDCGFIWDDDAYVLENETLQEPGGLARIWGDVEATPQWYPLVHTTFWLEARLWGLEPMGYHAVAATGAEPRCPDIGSGERVAEG